jgi:glucose-1-phosphate cytidylyltransferase
MTYGDGVADVNIAESIECHRRLGLKATLTAVQPLGRFGALGLAAGKVANFQEKPRGDGSWINGGFFVLEPSVFDYVDGDDTLWEKRPMELLSKEGQLAAYEHNGFWQPMDTLRDKQLLERLWEEGKAPWKTW